MIKLFSRQHSFAALALSTLLFIILFELISLPAAMLLGAMVAAIVVACTGGGVKIHTHLFYCAQGVIGCLMARAFTTETLLELIADWPILLGSVVLVLAVSFFLGYLIARQKVLPGTTAIWGIVPGAATVMTIMSEAYGADMRLVAFMQYLRVVIVTLAAALAARLWGATPVTQTSVIDALFAVPAWLPFAKTVLLIIICVVVQRLLKLPTGPVIVSLLVGTAMQNAFDMQITLPPLLLSVSYVILGWTFGLRFTPQTLAYAWRSLPHILGSIIFLMVLCAFIALFFVKMDHIDFLSAYLATSPGGADSIAIIAASADVNLPFVMALQTARFILALITGPVVARLVTRLIR